MTPLELLSEELDNVKRALRETLRHDYGPELSTEYYNECAARLEEIEKANQRVLPTDSRTISAHLAELSLVATWVSLIERSHLGEFSWPFANRLRAMATALFAEQNLKGDRLDPIIHIVAEGQEYQIVYEPIVPVSSGRKRFLIVAFPRSLKHHVLLHAIFGHELGHTALHATDTGSLLHSEVMTAFSNNGPITNANTITTWLNDANAPTEVKDALQDFQTQTGRPYVFDENSRQMWLVELCCDLFGLILFGPSFLAAHKTSLQPSHPDPFEFELGDSTHPPYAVRHKMLVRATQLLGWHNPVTTTANDGIYHAENELLNYILDDPYNNWAAIFDDVQLDAAIAGVKKIFVPFPDLAYVPNDSETLVQLVRRLENGLPPLLADIESDGSPNLTKLEISNTLYAGWVFWEGRSHLNITDFQPTFLLANMLCNHALLQQSAVDEVITFGKI